jgi:aspartate/methionine/tyrosine aminotransferase
MDTLAMELNEVLEGTVVRSVLSRYGEATFFPKGIVAQSAEAGAHAYRANGTAGVALSAGEPLSLTYFTEAVPELTLPQMVSYAPTAGDPALRQKWKEELVRKNPALSGKQFSLPVVTTGLTHAISIAADLFVEAGDAVLLPEPCWDNYSLIFDIRHNARVVPYALFDSQGTLDIRGMQASIDHQPQEKVVVLLNFPQNPTGYTPSRVEQEQLVHALVACARNGKKLVVIIDDAYFGLFHDPQCSSESLFGALCDADADLLAVKCDAATKEALVWGFRIGFITYGAQGLTNGQYHAMVQKTMGAIRASVSSCSRIGQSLLLAAMADGRYQQDTLKVMEEMADRYRLVKEALAAHAEDFPLLRPLPFNSGYFFALDCPRGSEELRVRLLKDHGVGTVAIGTTLLRIAYSSVDRKDIAWFIDLVYQVAGELWR